MRYNKLLNEYIDDCEVALSKVDAIISNNPDVDITLTICEEFDYNFKESLIAVRKADNNRNKGLGKFFNKDIYKPKGRADYVAMMFYRILTTVDTYDFASTVEMANQIVTLARDRQLSPRPTHAEVVEDNGDNQIRYKLTVVTGNEEPLSYAITNKETYIVVMTSLLTQVFAYHSKGSVQNFYNNYLLDELAKIQEGIPPTPYIEYSEKVRLSAYFERKVKGIPGKYNYVQSDYALDSTLETIRRNEVCLANRAVRPTKGMATTQEADANYDKKVAQFYDDTFLTPMGKGLTTTGKARHKTDL